MGVWRREDLPHLYLRHGQEWRALETSELDEALPEAREWSGDLLAGRRAAKGKALTLDRLFRLYRTQVSQSKRSVQRKEDERRLAVWLHYLGPTFDPLTLTGARLKAFERQRAAGTLKVPGRTLKQARAKTIREDLSFLRTVFRWAAGMDGGWLLPRNPMEGYKLPVEVNPRRPRAYWEDFEAVQKVAHRVDPLFPAFMALLESLGWRVSAVCQIQPADFDPTRTASRPHGRLLKRAETDKMGVERWTILGPDSRAALEQALMLTGRAGRQPLFPAPKSKGPWTRYHARALLLRAYELAEVPEDRRVGFHAYRRKWVDERKHLPRADVAAQGGWLSQRTLDIYEAPDEETLLAVAEEPRKLRIAAKT